MSPLTLPRLLTLCLLQASWTVLCCLKAALLARWALPSAPRTPGSVPAAALSLVASLLATALSPLEHRYSIKPSTVLSVYVLLTGLLDIAVARTLWLALPSNSIPAIFSTSLAVKLVILCLESLEKDGLLLAEWKDRAAEETANILSRSLFWWLNPVLWRGNRHDLTVDDLPGVDSALSHAEYFPARWSHGKLASRRRHLTACRIAIILTWKVDSHKADRHRLLYVLIKDLKWAILAGAVPRAGVIGFKYAQPFMTKRVVRWLDEPSSANSQNEGYGLVAAFALVFTCLAV